MVTRKKVTIDAKIGPNCLNDVSGSKSCSIFASSSGLSEVECDLVIKNGLIRLIKLN
jgi:hypothetical protein